MKISIKKNLIILLLNIIFLLFNVLVYSYERKSSLQNAQALEKDVLNAYRNSDYKKTAELLNQQIAFLEEDPKDNFQLLYKKQNTLAYIFAWKLNELDKAIKEYQKASELREKFNDRKSVPHTELLYIGDIHETKKDYYKALENYNIFLKEMVAYVEKENDTESVILANELMNFIKYRSDGINQKLSGKEFTPLLVKLKLSAQPYHFAFIQLLATAFVPFEGYEYEYTKGESDLISFIMESPCNINSEIFTYMLTLSVSAGEVNETSEKAMESYHKKYPEGYYSLILRYMFYKYYKENGQSKKAENLLTEIRQISRKRKIEIITSPDARFATPEKTWETYKKAMTEGDIETLKECYIPGEGKMVKAFSILGKENMKEIGEKMDNIQKITGNENSAEYRIKRKETFKGKEEEITYYIYFHNIEGEWKMQDF